MMLTQGAQAVAVAPYGQGVALSTPINEHALLNEFKMAAQSLIQVWSEGESADYPEALQLHVDWFRELLK